MDYTRKTWNENHKVLRKLFQKESTYKEAVNLFLDQHAMVHESDVSGVKHTTFEDELWEGMEEFVFRTGQNKKGRTVAYGVWHSTRIEDITMNLLVSGEKQIIDSDNWVKKINSKIYDTGNALSSDEILEFSKTIDMTALRDYRKKVGEKTREIVASLNYEDMKTKVLSDGLEKILSLGAVIRDEKAVWLVEFWKKKTIAGILLMPATRHHLVHINESLEAKKKGFKSKR